jgi:hypothetical protein
MCIHVCIKIKNIKFSDFFFLIFNSRLVTGIDCLLVTGKMPITDVGLFVTLVSVRNMVPTLTSSKRRGLSLNGRCLSNKRHGVYPGSG